MNQIGIIHLNQIGDLIFALPLLKALREYYPGAVIHSIIKPYLHELLDGCPWIDDVIYRKKSMGDKIDVLKTLRRNRYDLLISLPRSEECQLLTAFSRSTVRAGFTHPPWDFGLTIKETIEGHNSWFNNAKLLKRLSVPITKNDYVGLLYADDTIDDLGLPERYAVISPAASGRRMSKAWDQEKFADIIVHLSKKHQISSILVGSPDNAAYNAVIERHVRDKTSGNASMLVNLSGRIGLKKLCGVLRKAALFVGIDSGVMHLASAVDVPVVALFGPTDSRYVGPRNKKSIIVKNDVMDCIPCYLKKCSHYNCMQQLGAEPVKQACDTLLNTVPGP